MTRWHSTESLQVLTLSLQDEIFALDAARVLEILDMATVTELPNADPFINGLINVRGRVVPLADLRLKFGMEQRPPTIDTRIVVLEVWVDDEPILVGILADKVYKVTEIAAAALEETPRIGLRWQPEYIRCIGKQDDAFVIVLNVDALFTANQDPVSEPSALPVHRTAHLQEAPP